MDKKEERKTRKTRKTYLSSYLAGNKFSGRCNKYSIRRTVCSRAALMIFRPAVMICRAGNDLRGVINYLISFPRPKTGAAIRRGSSHRHSRGALRTRAL